MKPDSVMSVELNDVFKAARKAHLQGHVRQVLVDGHLQYVPYPFPSPGDWRDCPIYFVLIDRFNNPHNPPRSRWDGIFNFRQGGTLQGVQAKLGYIGDLGTKAIWLSPVLKNARPEEWAWNYHGYGAQDFLSVDERLGTETDLENLVTEAHARGLYVILDIVLNHAARVFDYVWNGAVTSAFQDRRLIDAPLGHEPDIQWMDGLGFPRADWLNVLPDPAGLSPDDAVCPLELQNALFFRRRGEKVTDEPDPYGFVRGDFGVMRQLVVEYDASDPAQPGLRERLGPRPVLAILIRAYAYLMARFDFDGYRLDTVKYVHPQMIQTFGNAMREFALSIGKRNFFTFGEIYDDETTIAAFVGRNGFETEGFGIDAALDFPLHYKLPPVVKGMNRIGVEALRHIFEERKSVEKDLLSSHGEAGRYFVSFLDSHDKNERFNHPDTAPPQVLMGIALMFALQGIPSLYYGTEQGLDGAKDDEGRPLLTCLESVREALWGKPDAFNPNSFFYQEIRKIAAVRAGCAPLRYGRLYFRQVSGNGSDFGYPKGAGGIIAFSRILFEQEVVTVANPQPGREFTGFVLVDLDINRAEGDYRILYSNADAQAPARVHCGRVDFWEDDIIRGSGLAAMLPVRLAPMEVQILAVSI
jgi:glycosidase